MIAANDVLLPYVPIGGAPKYGKPVGWFASSYKLLAEVWREMLGMLGPFIRSTNASEKRIELINDGVIDFWTLEDPDAGRGRKYARVIIDEAGVSRNLEQAWEQAIRPTLTDMKGDAFIMGTPKGRNYFYRLFARGEAGEPGWKSWRMGSVANPIIDAAEVEDARRMLPEAVFKQEYLGIPADDGGNPFGLSAIRACIGPLSTAEPVAWGVDLAKSEDYTVAIGLDESGAVCRFERWQGPWSETIERVSRLIGQTPAAIDSTGVGDAISAALHSRGHYALEGAVFTSKSKQQWMEGLSLAIQTQAVRYPDGPIVSELESFEYSYSKLGVKYCVGPDSLLMTADLRHVPAGEVQQGDVLAGFDESPSGDRRSRAWRRATVISAERITKPSYRVATDDGTSIVCSGDHLWLVNTGPSGLQWRTTKQLRAPHPTSKSKRFAPSRLVRVISTWEPGTDYRSGYVAGVLDGEGSLCQLKRSDRAADQWTLRLGFAQRDNELSKEMRKALLSLGVDWAESAGNGTNGDVITFGVTGRAHRVLRLLGIVRPKRILAKFDFDKLGSMIAVSTPKVVEIEELGEVEVVAIQTSTKTMIVNGLASHNCSPAGLHDDCVCALALAVYKLRQPAGLLIGWA